MNNKFKIVVLAITALVAIVTYINPVFAREQFLQQAGTVLLVALMLCDLRKRWFSNLAFLGIALFLMLHLVGARYIYWWAPGTSTPMCLIKSGCNAWAIGNACTRLVTTMIVWFTCCLVCFFFPH